MITPQQTQVQKPVVTPQLRQALAILQAPAVELRRIIVQELQKNPTLEEFSGDDISIEAVSDASNTPGETLDEELDFDDYRLLNHLDEDTQSHYTEANTPSDSLIEAQEKRQHFFDSVTSEPSLQTTLFEQAQWHSLSGAEQQGLEYLIGSLDQRGFLSAPLADLAAASGLPLAALQHAQKLLKTLDPPGLGSTDLQDCLLTQLKLQGKGQTTAAAIVRKDLDLLLRNRIPELARQHGLTISEIKPALAVIAALDPAPGRRFSEAPNPIIEPDVTIAKEHGVWTITLNDTSIPRLSLNQDYKTLMAQNQLLNRERKYLHSKIQSGKFFIHAIEQRRQTLQRLAHSLLRQQQAFFEHGIASLRPLTMREVAEDLGIHDSTISRAAAHKYLATPHGLFPFKYFFSAGYQTQDGKSRAGTSVKSSIQNIIANENPQHPYSDQKIVAILNAEGIPIARRTVAKYRDALGIPSVSLRRRHS